ncbi:MAG: hypothetical protein DBY42_02865 [Bacillota bacterium]|nr:MAG: hypothetical protein DBY42_02865 [Bacillota bacterium]
MISSPLFPRGSPLGPILACTLSIPRPCTAGRWGKTDHLPLALPLSIVEKSRPERGLWIRVWGSLCTWTEYDQDGVRQGRLYLLADRLHPLP